MLDGCLRAFNAAAIAAVLSGTASNLLAGPIELTCDDQATNFKMEIVVDVDRKVIWRQGFEGIDRLGWEVIEETPNLITARSFDASNNRPKHGGDLLVIDRQSGRFGFVSIGLFCGMNDCDREPLNVQSVVGTCSRKVL